MIVKDEVIGLVLENRGAPFAPVSATGASGQMVFDRNNNELVVYGQTGTKKAISTNIVSEYIAADSLVLSTAQSFATSAANAVQTNLNTLSTKVNPSVGQVTFDLVNNQEFAKNDTWQDADTTASVNLGGAGYFMMYVRPNDLSVNTPSWAYVNSGGAGTPPVMTCIQLRILSSVGNSAFLGTLFPVETGLVPTYYLFSPSAGVFYSASTSAIFTLQLRMVGSYYADRITIQPISVRFARIPSP